MQNAMMLRATLVAWCLTGFVLPAHVAAPRGTGFLLPAATPARTSRPTAFFNSDPVEDPTATGTWGRWALVQAAADGLTVAALAAVLKEDLVTIWSRQETFWFILGPAIMTFGAVNKRIATPTEREPPDFETDFFVQRLGGPDAVRTLRAAIKKKLSW